MTYWKVIRLLKFYLVKVFFIWETFTLIRFINLIKLYISHIGCILYKDNKVWGKPSALSIEPINVCNLKCPECPTGLRTIKRPKGMISLDSLMQILNKTKHHLWYLNLYFQGEPFMHPNFFELVKLAKKANLITETSTNGQYLSPEFARKTVKSGLDSIIISLDGTTQGVYEKYRVGGELNKVLEGIKNLNKAKKDANSKKPLTTVQFLVFKHNQHQINDINKLAKKLRVDNLEVKTAQIYNAETKLHLIPTINKLSRYALSKDGLVEFKGKVKNNCWKMWSSAVVTWDGKMVPCCFDKDANYNMGSLIKSNAGEVWYGSGYKEFRGRVYSNQEDVDICSNCPLSRKQ